MTDAEAKQTMLLAADQYDELAKRIEGTRLLWR